MTSVPRSFPWSAVDEDPRGARILALANRGLTSAHAASRIARRPGARRAQNAALQAGADDLTVAIDDLLEHDPRRLGWLWDFINARRAIAAALLVRRLKPRTAVYLHHVRFSDRLGRARTFRAWLPTPVRAPDLERFVIVRCDDRERWRALTVPAARGRIAGDRRG